MDLLTAVAHELGHVAGHSHGGGSHSIMAGTLNVGERRVAEAPEPPPAEDPPSEEDPPPAEEPPPADPPPADEPAPADPLPAEEAPVAPGLFVFT